MKIKSNKNYMIFKRSLAHALTIKTISDNINSFNEALHNTKFINKN